MMDHSQDPLKRVLGAAHKDRQTSYGLTLVAGMPFSAELAHGVAALQGEIERQAAGVFSWYGPEHLHITLAAPLRGRYRPSPPLQRSELPADTGGFFRAVGELFGSLPPLSFTLTRPHMLQDGHCILSATCQTPIREQLARICQKFPGLDPVDPHIGLHITLGYCVQAIDPERLAPALDLDFTAVEMVNRAWLVHYANRTLNQVIGRIDFETGAKSAFDTDNLLTRLGIAGDPFPSRPE